MSVRIEVHELTLALCSAGGRQESSPAYEIKAWDMYRRWIEEAAYFLWVDRGRPLGDPLTDWVAAEAAYRRRVDSDRDVFQPDQLRRQAIEVEAYLNYTHRAPDAGDPVTDWRIAEEMAVQAA